MLKHVYSTGRTKQTSKKVPKSCQHQSQDLLWFDVDTIYQITCPHCGEIYIGETHRQLQQRAKEHMWAIKSGDYSYAMAVHFRDKHPEHVQNPKSSVKIITKGGGHVLRLLKEATIIHLRKPEKNRKVRSLQSADAHVWGPELL